MKRPIPDKVAAMIRGMRAEQQRIEHEVIGMVKASALIYGIDGDFRYNLDTMTIETPEADQPKE